jgi:cytochrome c-type biogenesis protein CcmH/NrfG
MVEFSTRKRYNDNMKANNDIRISCPKCGEQIQQNYKFCSQCGVTVTDAIHSALQEKGVTHSKRSPYKTIAWSAALLGVAYAGFTIFTQSMQPAANSQQQQPPPQSSGQSVSKPEAMAALTLPTDYDELVKMGHEHMDNGDFVIAAECYKRALNIRADTPDIRVDFGACLHEMGLDRRAIEEFGLVIAEHPKHKIALFNLGVVHYGMQTYDSAKFYWDKFLAIEPTGQGADVVHKMLADIPKK